MAGVNFQQLYAKFREIDTFAAALRSATADVAGKVDFGHVKSCLAFATHSGEREMEFARRLLPNLRSFTAVDRDSNAVKALRANFQKGLLPGVQTSVIETSIESWSGGEKNIDAVFLFNALGSVKAADRKALFEKLATQSMSDGGMVVIATNITSVPSGYTLLVERLGTPRVDYDVVEKEMVAAGFRVVYKQDFKFHRDLSNPSNDTIEMFEFLTGRSESEIRTAIDSIFSQPNMDVVSNKLAIFTKQVESALCCGD